MKLSLGRFFGRGATIPTVAVPKAVFDLSPKTEVCRVVLDHWQSLRGDRLLPRHAEFDRIRHERPTFRVRLQAAMISRDNCWALSVR
jgi:hypothetical protein